MNTGRCDHLFEANKGGLALPTGSVSDGVVVGIPDCINVLRSKAMTPPCQKVFANDIYPPAVQAASRRCSRVRASHPLWTCSGHLTQMPTLPGQRISPRGERSAHKINTQLVKTPAYRDENVASGKTYWYRFRRPICAQTRAGALQRRANRFHTAP